MAIKLITGVPGAGKTYLALKLLTEQYYEWSKELQEYIRKDEFKNYTIITNIDELCLDTLDLTDVINQCNTNFETFFTKDFQEKVTKKHGSILYIIDEAQRHIGYYFRNKETLFYFDYHRHFDHEVWLITQHRYKINRNISTLAEMEYRAVKRSLAVFGEFKYNLMSDGEIFDRKIFKSDKKIFDIYKSMVGNQNQVQKNSFAKYIIIPIICLFIAGYMLRSRMTHAKRTGEKLGQKTTTQNIKETTTLKKQKLKKNNKRKKRETRLINTNDKNWISVSTIKVNNKIKYIVHPVTNELYPKNLFPYDLTYTSSSVWANVPTNQLSKNKNFVSDNRTHKTFFSPEQKITTN